MNDELVFLSSPSVLEGQEHPLLVLLHGSGSDEKDLMALRPYIDPKWAMVSIRAPFPQGAGFRWYALESVHSPDRDEMDRSFLALRGWFEQLTSRFPRVSPRATVIGGFSQGAAMALALGLFEPQVQAAGILVLSGYLPNLPQSASTWQKVPVFWGHGSQDTVLPYVEAEKGRQRLLEEGLAVDFHSYEMGHEVVEEELSDAVSWLKQFGI